MNNIQDRIRHNGSFIQRWLVHFSTYTISTGRASVSIWDNDTFFITFCKAEYKILELGCPSLWCQSKIRSFFKKEAKADTPNLELKAAEDESVEVVGMGYTHPYSTLWRGSSRRQSLNWELLSIKITKCIILKNQFMNRQEIGCKIRNLKYIIKPKIMSRSLKLTMTNMSDRKLLSIAYSNCLIAPNKLLMQWQLRQIGSNMIWAPNISKPTITWLHLWRVSYHWG